MQNSGFVKDNEKLGKFLFLNFRHFYLLLNWKKKLILINIVKS